MKTLSIWRVYVTWVIQAQGSPWVDPACTFETVWPKRKGRGYAVRLPLATGRPSRALVVGLWERHVR